MRRDGGNDPIHVVFVCTGNRFRSPLAEALLRRAVPPYALRTDSYGTLNVGTAPPLDEAVIEARRFGIDLSEHAARPITDADLSRADLVVGFERHHGVSAIVEARARRERTFTLAELVPALEAIKVAPRPDPLLRAQRALTLLDSHRRPAAADWDPPEVVDPLGLARDAQREIAHRVEDLTTRLARALFGEPGG